MGPNVLPPQSRKRTRETEDNNLPHSKTKTKHSGLLIHSSISTSEPTPAYAATVDSLRPHIAPDSCITDVATGMQDTIATANTTRDQRPNPYTDDSTASNATRSTLSRKAKAKPLETASKIDQQNPASGIQATSETFTATRSRRATNEFLEPPSGHTNDQRNVQNMNRDPYTTQPAVAHIEGVARGGHLEAPNLRNDGSTNVPRQVNTTTPSSSAHESDSLRWKSSPFTLVHVGNGLCCPRLIVDPHDPLSRILPPLSYPLDIAVMTIHEYGCLGNSLPCEARRILILYDKIRQLDLSDTNITLLDPDLFRQSSIHSPARQQAFQKNLGSWITHLGHGIEFPDVYHGTWDLKGIRVNYSQLRIFLCLSKGIRQTVYPLAPGFDTPPEIEKPLQVRSG